MARSRMTLRDSMTAQYAVISCLLVTSSGADQGLNLQNNLQGQYEPPAEGGYVSPSQEFDGLLHELEQYEKPELPHVAPIDDVYNQLDETIYEKYNIDKQDDIEEEEEEEDSADIIPILTIIVPSVVIGLVALIFSVVNPVSIFSDIINNTKKKTKSRAVDSLFSFLPKPQVDNNIVIGDLFNLDNILGRIKRDASREMEIDYMSYLLNSVEVISNLKGGIKSTSCELNHLARNPKFPTLSRIISPFMSDSFGAKFSSVEC